MTETIAGGAKYQTTTERCFSAFNPNSEVRFRISCGPRPPDRFAATKPARIRSPQTKRQLKRREVAVPLASLGLTNSAGKTIGFDLSVGIANDVGNRRERAAPWTGLSEAFVMDGPGSTRLLPETWRALTFALSPEK